MEPAALYLAGNKYRGASSIGIFSFSPSGGRDRWARSQSSVCSKHISGTESTEILNLTHVAVAWDDMLDNGPIRAMANFVGVPKVSYAASLPAEPSSD